MKNLMGLPLGLFGPAQLVAIARDLADQPPRKHTTPKIIEPDIIEISADFAQASSVIKWRPIGDTEWRATPFQTADARHDGDEAVRIVNEWLDACA